MFYTNVFVFVYMMFLFWYHLYNLKNVNNTGVLLLVKVTGLKLLNTRPRVFFTFFKLYERYQIAQYSTYYEWEYLIFFLYEAVFSYPSWHHEPMCWKTARKTNNASRLFTSTQNKKLNSRRLEDKPLATCYLNFLTDVFQL